MADTDVVIVGAGPTGLALACGLLASGVAVRLVDAAAGPARTSRALGLQPRGTEVIDRLGALGGLPTRAVRIGQVMVHVNGRQVASLRVGQRTRLVTRPGLLVSQAEVEAGLRRRVGQLGGQVEWGRALLAAEQDAHGVTVELGGRQTVRTGWLVGCDGAHSRVRKLAGIDFPGVAIIERFLLADVHADLPLARDSVSVWLRGEDMLGAFPLPGADLWRLMAPAPVDSAEDLGRDEVLGLLARLLVEHSGHPASRVRDSEWTSTFRVHRRLAGTYRRGRMLLAGDAAHIHSPVGGQGLNTGLGDAENLAWKLALVVTGRADHSLLDSYQAERRPVATEVLSSTTAMTRLVLGDSAVARQVRDHVLVPLMNRPRVQRRIWEKASQLGVSYRHGPLAPRPRHLPTNRGPRCGDRVPDLACHRLDGSGTRLHAELGARWALLTPSTTTAEACAAVARKRLGADGVTVLVPARRQRDIMLVRPDGHLGWRGMPAPDALDRWLTGVLEHGRAR
jgi:4,5-epoxidase